MKFRPKQCPGCLWYRHGECEQARPDNCRFKGESDRYCYAYEGVSDRYCPQHQEQVVFK